MVKKADEETVMRATIIIPTRNREQILLNSLEYTMRAVESLDVEVIVVNDGDNPIVLPEKWKDKIHVITNRKHSVAAARNAGARAASAPLLLFFDDDMLINATALKKMIALAEEQPARTINLNWEYPPALLEQLLRTKFGRYLHRFGFTSLRGWNNNQPWNEAGLFENIGVTSQCLAIRKSDFESVHGYDESFPHAGFEDYDFAKRLHGKGVRFFIWPEDIIYHNETDRHELRLWLQRKERGGETRKIAVERGNTELELHYTGMKNILLQFFAATENFWIALVSLFPNMRAFDGIYGKIVNVLLATSIFKGYQKVKG